MLPWISWRLFLLGTATNPGNGGPLLQPRGQTSVLYAVPPPLEAQQAQQPPPRAGDGPGPAAQAAHAQQQTAGAEALQHEQQ